MAKILIVEDRDVDRLYLTKLLGYYGHAVVQAGDGAEALDRVATHQPDLVISDIQMPTMDGYEFVRRLRDLPVVASTPVMFYSAQYHEREARALASQCGVTEILSKPSEAEAIMAKVHAALGRRSTQTVRPADAAAYESQHLNTVNLKLADKIRQLEYAQQQMSAVVDIAKMMSNERRPVELLRKVAEATRRITLARHVTVAWLAEDKTVQATFTSGPPSGPAKLDADALPRMLETVVSQRRPIRQVRGRAAEASPSLLAVPIASPDRVFGWLAAEDKLGADGFSDSDEYVVTAIASHAAIAYENACLHEEHTLYVAALKDEVEERSRVQEVLRENDERTAFAMAAAHMGVWELDLDSKAVSWSASLAPVFGLMPDAAPTTIDAFLALVCQEDRPAVEAGLKEALQGAGYFKTDFRALWPDGTLHWVGNRAQVVRDPEGRAIRVLGVGVDIHNSVVLEQQLHQAQKMEAVGQLASGVAHDFNNLLTVIRGYAEFLLQDVPAPQREDVREILMAADGATSLTRQLLTFSRRQVVQRTVLDLNELIGNLSKMMRRVIGDHIELETLLAQRPATVLADSGQIEQVLMNLVVNARDAMPYGGRISIETADVAIDQTAQFLPLKPGAYVRMTVTDNGMGMDEETQARAFEPLFTTKAPGKGTGLGLSTTRSIIAQSGGEVLLYSELGKGTAFKIFLPAAEEVARPAPAARRPTRVATASVLLVEDEAPVRHITKTILERAGYSVVTAGSALEAEAYSGTHRPDLLLTDVIMPHRSGPVLFARLADRYPGLRVLYISGYTDETIVEHGVIDVTNDFLQKPFSADGLLRKVQEVLAR